MKRILLVVFCFLQIVSYADDFTDQKKREVAEIFPFLESGERWTRMRFQSFMASKGIRFSGSETLLTARLNNRKFFGVPAVEMRGYFDKAHLLESIDITFANKGDSAGTKNMNRAINRNGKDIHSNLTLLYGSAVRKKFGSRKISTRGVSWKAGASEIALERVRNEYVVLHLFIGQKKSSAHLPLKFDVKSADVSQKVKKNDFGDVFIADIPMVNQGNKGYCVPATVERVLRHYGINNINMHFIADKANTGTGGGTSFKGVTQALIPIGRALGLTLVPAGDVRIGMLKKYIDRGFPVFWFMYVNQEYEAIRRSSRTQRKQSRSAKAWAKEIRSYRVPGKGEAHVCLVIGYNAETEEIAVSNSWGAQEVQPTWVPLRVARKVSQGRTFILYPR